MKKMYDNPINKDSLNPGDVVGIKRPIQIGWGYFRYHMTIPMTIERITPARTKFVMTNGCEYDKNEPFYPISEETEKKTQIAQCAQEIHECLFKLDTLRKQGKLYTQDDEFIVKAAGLLEQVCKEIDHDR